METRKCGNAVRRRRECHNNVRKRDRPTALIGRNWVLRKALKCGTNRVMSLGNDESTMRDERKTSRSELPEETGQTDYKRSLAYRRLGINPNEVLYFPFLATQLRRIARTIRGVRVNHPPVAPVRPLEYLGFSEDPEARKVLKAYHSVPQSYRRLLRPEDFCHAAGVSPRRVLEIIAVIAVSHVGDVSAIIGAMLHARVIAKTVERALQHDGIRERRMLHRAVGYIGAGRRVY